MQIVEARRRDWRQERLARDERLAGWRLEVYRDLLIRLDPLSAPRDKEAVMGWARLEDDLDARVQLIASVAVRSAADRLTRLVLDARMVDRPSHHGTHQVVEAVDALRLLP